MYIYRVYIFFIFLITKSVVSNGQIHSTSLSQTKKHLTLGAVYSKTNSIQSGYTLICPSNSKKTFLINNDGRLINQWSSSYSSGQSACLMEDGSLIRASKTNNTKFTFGGISGRLEKRDWNNQLIWEWELNDTNKCLHHDIVPLPNGNILVMLVERKFLKEALLAGRDTSKLSDKELWNESVLEIKPQGKNEAIVIWQWNAWDHLTQNKYPDLSNYSKSVRPELIDINYNLDLNSSANLICLNSIDYNPQLDQILLSARNYNEIWIIDHTTPKDQVKGHKGGKSGKGGDLIYRWGNPKSYGINESSQLDGQSNASWIMKGYINEGKIAIFDNRISTGDPRLIMIAPSLNKATFNYNSAPNKSYLPKTISWSYKQPTLSQSRGGGNIQGLSNGNILLYEISKARLMEITQKNDTAWTYVVPVSEEYALTQGSTANSSAGVFKSNKYPISFKGFEGKNMIPGATLELNPDMQYGRIEINKSLDTLKEISLSLSSNCYLSIDEITLFFNQPISVYNSSGVLIDEQSIPQKGKWYLGIYKEGVYYFECKNRYLKVRISK